MSKIENMTVAEQLAFYKAENEALKTAQAQSETRGMSLKVADKGGLSLYGLGRFPVTLFPGQWLKLVDKTTDIIKFMAANFHEFSYLSEEVVKQDAETLRAHGIEVTEAAVATATSRVPANVAANAARKQLALASSAVKKTA